MTVVGFEQEDLVDGPEAMLHHALAATHRRQLVAELREAGTPLDTSYLAETIGLHPNTVRWHLRVLEKAGIVGRRPLPSGRPGRPRLGFALLPPATPQDTYRLLATVLASSLADRDDGRKLAAEAGRAEGRHLAGEIEPAQDAGTADGADRLARLLEHHGFRPELTEDGIAMRACPYHALGPMHGTVVCAAHQGLIEGALDELGVGLRVAALVSLPEGDGSCSCTVRLEPVD